MRRRASRRRPRTRTERNDRHGHGDGVPSRVAPTCRWRARTPAFLERATVGCCAGIVDASVATHHSCKCDLHTPLQAAKRVNQRSIPQGQPAVTKREGVAKGKRKKRKKRKKKKKRERKLLQSEEQHAPRQHHHLVERLAQRTMFVAPFVAFVLGCERVGRVRFLRRVRFLGHFLQTASRAVRRRNIPRRPRVHPSPELVVKEERVVRRKEVEAARKEEEKRTPHLFCLSVFFGGLFFSRSPLPVL